MNLRDIYICDNIMIVKNIIIINIIIIIINNNIIILIIIFIKSDNNNINNKCYLINCVTLRKYVRKMRLHLYQMLYVGFLWMLLFFYRYVFVFLWML